MAAPIAPRIILITGANRGIGAEVARTLAQRPGTTVIAACRNETSSAAAAKSLPAGVIHVQIDVGDSKSTARAAEALKEAGVTGQLDCLVNNAGVLHNGWTQQDWDATMTTNVRGPIELTRTLLPLIRDGGKVVNVSSSWGQLAELGESPLRQAIEGAQTLDDVLRLASPSGFDPRDPHMSKVPVAAPYKVSKALLNRATRIIAADPAVKQRGITVNGLCPGWVRTDMGGANAEVPVTEGAARVLTVVDDAEGHMGSVFMKARGWSDTDW